MLRKQKIIVLLFPLFLFSISACRVNPFTTPTPTNTSKPTLTPVSTKTSFPTKITAATIAPNPDLVKDFVGIYRKAAREFYECNLEISRDSTFKLKFINTINGLTRNVNGIISYSDGQFLLTQTEADINAYNDYQCFPQALVPIYWKERRYLFMNSDNSDGMFDWVVSLFCDDLRNGQEPRSNIDDIHGIYFLRETDLTIKVTSFPVRVDGQLLCPSN